MVKPLYFSTSSGKTSIESNIHDQIADYAQSPTIERIFQNMSNFGVSTSQTIYTGVWTNWSHGKVYGSTLTLTQIDGNLLVAFLALFVSFAGTSFFRLICFMLHYVFSSKNIHRLSEEDLFKARHNALHHQRQAVLRNSSSTTDGLVSSILLLWQWRRSRRQASQEILPFSLLTVVLLFGFTVAGIYSSQIAAFTGDEVLISSKSCAIKHNRAGPTLDEYAKIWTPYYAQRLNAYLTYAQDCYLNDSRLNQESCKVFVKPNLYKEVDHNAPCPFRHDMCRTSNGNIKIDTGYLNTHWDLGFNAPESHRMLYRKILHCAPLVTSGYSDLANISVGGLQLPYKRYFYGQEFRRNYSKEEPTYTQAKMTIDQLRLQAQSSGYGLWTSHAKVVNGSLEKEASSWWPIEPLQRNDSDAELIFLSSNEIGYLGQVDDPWFSAHQFAYRTRAESFGEQSLDVYQSDEVASPLGCTIQYQLCPPPNPSPERCTALGGWLDTRDNLPANFKNDTSWFIRASLAAYGLGNVIGMGGQVLASKYTLLTHTNAALPANQWQIEVERFFDIMLASMQGKAVETASEPIGQLKEDISRLSISPQNEAEKKWCKNQKIRSSTHQNFSVLGLTVICVIGGLIILISWMLECIYVDYIWNNPRFNQYPRLEWITNGTLQLQRLAHEGLSDADWKNCDGAVPRTNLERNLAILDLKDLKHPRLQKLARKEQDISSSRGHSLTTKIPSLPSNCTDVPDDTFAIPNGTREQKEVFTLEMSVKDISTEERVLSIDSSSSWNR